MAKGAYIIHTGSKPESVIPKNGTDFGLEELQKIVGGLIEIVQLDEDRIMVINEEGKLLGLPINEFATEVYRVYNNTMDVIVGEALICMKTQVK